MKRKKMTEPSTKATKTGNDLPLFGDDPEAKIGMVNIGGVDFLLVGSLIQTVRIVEDHPRKHILQAFRAIMDSGDYVPEEPSLVTNVVKGAVQLEWYRAAKRDVPEQVTQNQEDRMAKAKAPRKGTKKAAATKGTRTRKGSGKTPATVAAEGGATTEAAVKTPKTAKPKTARSRGRALWPEKKTKGAYIRHLLGEGKNDEQIMKAVDKQFPDKRATNAQDIKFERSLIKREGL